MSKAFVIAEHEGAARELCAGARTLADEVILVSIGSAAVPDSCADRVARIAVPEGEAADDAAETVSSFYSAEHPSFVLVEPTRHNRVIAGRVAAAAGTSVVPDAVSLVDGVAESMYFGGVGKKLQRAKGEATFCFVASGAFAGCEPSGGNAAEDVAWVAPGVPLKVVSSAAIEKSGVDLQQADVVVSAGRGFASEDELGLARDLADKLGGGLGCTRPVAEGLGWLPPELYIGVSGQVVAPKAYIAIGLSGQMQHMVGCNRSGKVFAINKDENALIFKQCDYGLVGSIADVLPKVVAAL